MLVDAFGRPFRDLRISVTDRCNFRCFYCHNEGQGSRVAPPGAPRDHEMTADEIARIVDVATSLGVQTIKLTGGEPLLRPDVDDIVRHAASTGAEVSMTTNGALLADRAAALAEAGLARVNVSIDSLDPNQFHHIRGGRLEPVLAGVSAALDNGLRPLKLNVVVTRDTQANIVPMLDFVGRTEGLELQLIQFMPEMAWTQQRAADVAGLRRWLEEGAERVEVRQAHRRRRYLVRGAWVELVDPVNNADFCANCHRLRLTADGRLKGCINVGAAAPSLRGMDQEAIAAAFRDTVARRRPFYPRVEESAPGASSA